MNNNQYVIAVPSTETLEKEVNNIPALDKPDITTNEEAKTVGSYLSRVTEYRKKVESLFKPVLDAIRQSSKQVHQLQNRILEPLETKEKIAREALSRWETQLWKQRQKELNKNKETTAIVTADTRIENISYRTEYIPYITDFKLFLTNIIRGKIPENCVTVDMGLLKKLGTQAQGALNFPGVKWEAKRIPVVRSSKDGEEEQ